MVAEARDCLSDRVCKSIVDRICDGVYAPGERLIELQIAREFKSSQAPIREALCKLEAMRLVETKPYKGTRVREISSRELDECLRVRSVLENLAAEQVEDRLKDKIDDLKQKALLTVEAARQRDLRKYGFANIEFHRFIIEASNNQTLIALWDSLAPLVRMVVVGKASADQLQDGASDHLEIIEAFAEGDNRFAGKLLKKHAEFGLRITTPDNALSSIG
jgi:DNA-binding GntR family transcriptional regulator